MYIPSIRPGRIASAIAAAVMTASLVAAPAYADSHVVATIGADLTPAQKQTVIDYFGSNMNGADIIYVTNADEHAHLDGYIPYEQIGNATYSCALICPTTSGGIRVRAANLNYVTADMLASALSSAGVRNADVIAICPFKVSGTGALTGVLLAYETATGQPLDQTKKDVATQELVVTQTISNQVGPDAATLIVNDVKANVIMNNVTDESQIDAIVETTVNNVVNNTTINNVDNSTTIVDNSTTVIDNSTVNVTEVTVNNNPSGLTDEDIAALKELAKSYAAAGYNYNDMAETLNTVSQNASASSGIADPMAKELADAADSAAKDSGAGSAGDAVAKADDAGATTGTAGTQIGAAGATTGAADTASTPNAGTATDATDVSSATTGTTGAAGAATDAAGTTAGAADGAAAGTTTDTNATPGAGTTDAASTPTETPAPSIFDGTDDAALGDDVHVTATDQSAAADTTTTGAGEPATDPNDPFANVTWDESGDTSQQPGGQPADGQTGAETTGAEAGQPSSSEPPQTPGDTADSATLPEPPVPAQSSSVTLVAAATARATDLVDGTALAVFEENGQYGLTDAVDGAHLTDAAYTNAFQASDGLVVATQAADGKMVLLDAQGKQLLSGAYDEIRILSAKWALGIQRGSMEFDNSVDVYYLPGSTTMPAGTTTSDLLSDARANGDYVNIVAASGAVSAYNTSFMPVEGAAPTAIDDFSYAGVSSPDATLDGAAAAAEPAALPALGGTELAVDETTVASPAEGTAGAGAQPAEGVAAPAQETPAGQPTEGVATPTDATTAEQPAGGAGAATPADAATSEQPVDGTSEAAGEPAATALPQNAVELSDTNGLLYTAAGADNKTHLYDANGLDLFNLGFDQVISAHNGGAVVLVDKTANVAWAFQVKAPATL